jgi:acetyl esterase/lipase
MPSRRISNQASRPRPYLEATLALLLFAACLWVDPAAAQQQYSVRGGIVYGPSQQQLDLYQPALPRKRSALLFVHGGGFREGSKEQMASLCALYAQAGFAAATINYRLAPAHPFPAALEDTTHAVAWLRGQAAVQGFDPRKIVLIGYSAGANLALMVGLADGSGVAGIVSAAAPSDLVSLLAQTPLAKLKSDLREYLGATPAEFASPLGRVSPGDPRRILVPWRSRSTDTDRSVAPHGAAPAGQQRSGPPACVPERRT